jgi:hypothetical protein
MKVRYLPTLQNSNLLGPGQLMWSVLRRVAHHFRSRCNWVLVLLLRRHCPPASVVLVLLHTIGRWNAWFVHWGYAIASISMCLCVSTFPWSAIEKDACDDG